MMQQQQQDLYDKDIQRLERRIDVLQTDYATLRDVDRRFAEDRTRLQMLESNQVNNSRIYIDLIDRINSSFDKKLTDGLKPITDQIDRLDHKVDGVEHKVDGVKEKSSEATTITLRYIVSVIVSFALGTGAIGALQYFESILQQHR